MKVVVNSISLDYQISFNIDDGLDIYKIYDFPNF